MTQFSVSPVSVLAGAGLLKFCQHLIQREAAGLLPGRELLIRGQVLAYEGLRRDEQKHPLGVPSVIVASQMVGVLERIGAEVEHLGRAQRDEWISPDLEAFGPLLQEHDLPPVIAQGGEIAIVGPIKELFALARPGAGQQIALVVAVEMDLESLA